MVTPAFLPVLPELFLAGSSLCLVLRGVFAPEDRRYSTVAWWSIAVILVALIFAITMQNGVQFTALNNFYATDPLVLFMKSLVLIGSACAIFLTFFYVKQEEMVRFEHPLLMVLATLGMMVMVSANDLMSLYIGIELQSLSLYILAAMRRNNQASSEAGLKYFILGALSSGMLLYGCSLIYGYTGSTNFADINTVLSQMPAPTSLGLLLGMVFLIMGLAFKVSAVPFHMWTPDVYQGSPTPVTAFFATAPKIAALALFIRVMMGPFEPITAQWQQILYFLSVSSMIVGAVGAIFQSDIKRLLAYSSIGHMGYALVGLVAANPSGIRGILVYISLYLVMGLGTFACILMIRRDGREVTDVEGLRGLSLQRPFLAFCMAAFMLSMAGIPPLAGFFGKYYVFMAAVDAGFVELAIIGVLSSVVAAFYYLRVVKVMYFDELDAPFDTPQTPLLKYISVIAAAIVVLFFLFPSVLVELASRSSAFLFI